MWELLESAFIPCNAMFLCLTVCVSVTSEAECPALPTDWPGPYTCDNGLDVGSNCHFICAHDSMDFYRSCADPGSGVPEWTYREPTCLETSCFPAWDPPIRGIMNCTDYNLRGSVCTFECPDGRTVVSTCEAQGDGTSAWSADALVCETGPALCDPIPDPAHGFYTCVGHRQQDAHCYMGCHPGYAVPARAVAMCSKLGSGTIWINSFEECFAYACDVIQIENGHVTCNDTNVFYSVCTPSCSDGYDLSSEDPIKCRPDRTWSPSIPTCDEEAMDDESNCFPILAAPPNGELDCTNGIAMGSTCTFSCPGEDYVLSTEDNALLCDMTETGQAEWSSSIPTCVDAPKNCAPADPIPNGAVTCSDGDNRGSICTFTCDEGYGLVPPERTTSTCNPPNWSDDQPSCEEGAVVCDAITAPEHGSVTCTDSANENSDCSFECQSGYVLSASETAKCTKLSPGKGQWSISPPICNEGAGACDALAAPEHGSMTCTDQANENSVCSFECQSGYIISASETTTCAKVSPGKGEWSLPAPTCDAIPVLCDESPSDSFTQFTTLTCDGNTAGSQCTFNCKGGTKLLGNSTITCVDKNGDGAGEWSSIPNCYFESCKELKVDNAEIVCNDTNKAHSVCEVFCKTGFVSTESDLLQCSSLKGSWDGVTPECSAIDCTPPLDAIFPSATSCDNKPGSKCDVECAERSEKPGQTVTYVCADPKVRQGAGYWSESIKVCAGCGRGLTDLVIVLDASSNFSPADFAQLRDWTGGLIQHLGPLIDSGVFWISVTIAASREQDCEDGSASVPLIEMISELGPSKLSQVQEDLLEGQHSKGCLHLGQALSEATSYLVGTQRPHAVPVILLLLGGASTDPIEGGIKLAKAANIQILLVGVGEKMESIDTMSITGQKKTIFHVPERKLLSTVMLNALNILLKIDCPGFSQCTGPVDGGHVTCEDAVAEGRMVRSNEVCKVSCDEGLILVGEPGAMCGDADKDGEMEWLSTKPGCEEVYCPEKTRPDDGFMSCTNENILMSVCKFWCLPDYFMIGTSASFCGDPDQDGTGEWNTETPWCVEQLECMPVLKAPVNGEVKCSEKNIFGTKCKYKCGEGYELEGGGIVHCGDPLPDGNVMWSSEPPRCKACRTPNCKQALIVLMDGSGSIKASQFLKMKEWIIEILNGFKGEIDGGGTQVGLIQYSGEAEFMCDSGEVKPKYAIELEMGRYTFYEVHQRIMDIGHLRGCTKTGDAIKRAIQHFESLGENKTERVLIVVTDGKSNDQVEAAATEARDKNIKMIAIGIGKFETSDLKAIAGTKKVIDVTDFDHLDSAIPSVRAQIRAQIEEDVVEPDFGRTTEVSYILIVVANALVALLART